ncbi:MAG: gamma-glutamyltransferase [Candidatus Hydrogenedentota bacterium]
MDRRTFLSLAGVAGMSTLLGGASSAQERSGAPINEMLLRGRNQNRSTVVARHGMVCTSQPLASLAGIDTLRAGGSAVDAAIAANAMLGLTEPMSCGLGGDLFAIVWWEKEKKLYGLNASGRSPYAWSLEAAKSLNLESIPSQSPLAWSVPGCASGWAALAEKFGAIPFKDVLQPAITTARDGFPVSPIIARGWPFPTKFENLGKTYAPGGQHPRFGDIFQNPALANTLEILARDGAQAYYQGEIAEKLVRFSESVGGKFALKDFTDHTATWVEPVSTSYRGYDVWEIPPNGQGIAVLQILNLLEHFDIGSLTPNSAEHLHLFIEAKKLAYEDRAIYYADPEKADVPVDWLISKDYGKERVQLINPNKASMSVKPGAMDGSTDTIYLATADRHGNMVSFIQSIYSGWGSHFAPEDLGFAIQNRGSAFTLNADHRNRLEPHKRPFHTIIPGFLTREGKAVMPFGVMGGDFQPQGHSQVLMNMIDFGYSVQQAGDQPRIEHAGSSDPDGSRMEGAGIVACERHIGDDVKEKLAALGHTLKPGFQEFGGYQAVWREDDPLRYFGGSDPRKDGCAIGY